MKKARKLELRVCWIVIMFGCGVLLSSCAATDVTDANNDTPRSRLGESLQARATTTAGHIEAFYNTSDTDAVEGVSEEAAEFVANCAECAWFLFVDPSMSDYPFHNPLGSPHFETTQTVNIPLWVRASCDEEDCEPCDEEDCDPCTADCLGPVNGGGGQPRLSFSPFGALFGCSRCSNGPPSGYDATALHEFGHVLFKSYNAFLNSGPVGFLNEGLPSGIVEVPLSSSYSPRYPNVTPRKSLRAHLDLADTSLRNRRYSGSPFWYFLAMKYTNIPDSDGYYDVRSVQIPEVCRQYANAIQVPVGIRRLPGQDVILHIQEEFARCHPLGLDTPNCRVIAGEDLLMVRCASHGYPGCVPAGFPNWSGQWMEPGETDETSEGPERVGEVLMPLVLDLIDNALEEHHSMVRDGLPYQAFREFLVENYLNGAGEEVFLDPDPADPSYPYRIKSFGAHYHEFNVRAAGSVIDLEKGPDLPQWAYHVFYMDGDTPVPHIPWRDLDSDQIHIPPVYDKAVLVVTAFEGTYDLIEPYPSSGGHYGLTEERMYMTMTGPPIGSACFVGEPCLIQWDSHAVGRFVTIRYSIDGGANWDSVNPYRDFEENDGEYEWYPKHRHLSESVLIRITSYAYPTISTTHAGFAIRGRGISVTSPRRGDIWFIGEPAEITWTSHNIGDTVDIELYRRNYPEGGGWTPLALKADNDGSYTWTVSSPASDDCTIKVTSRAYREIDDLSQGFFIHERGLKITVPHKATTYYVGEDAAIHWEGFGIGDQVMLELSRDNGLTWSPLEASTENDGYYVWRATESPSTQCRVRVTSLSDPSYADMSDDFTIDYRTTTVKSPNGGETLHIGTPYTIKWQDNFYQDARVEIVLVRDGVDEWIAEITGEGQSEFVWTVTGPASSRCIIMIIHTRYGVEDSSDAYFSIK
jgi:hypothetical protein